MADSKDYFWLNFIKAIGAEPREHQTIAGSSGIEHRVLGVGVDDKGSRLVLISDHSDARSAAMMQVDVQSTVGNNIRVIVARPVAANTSVLAQMLISLAGTDEFRFDRLPESLQEGRLQKTLERKFSPLVEPIKRAFKAAPLNVLSQLQHIMAQLASLDIEVEESESGAVPIIKLRTLSELDVMQADRELGICPVPLYEFAEDDLELVRSGVRVDDINERLHSYGVRQYFYPAPDHTALGIAERRATNPVQIVETLERSPSLGHPFGDPEIVDRPTNLNELLDNLQERGFITEGEAGFHVTQQGQEVRATVKFRPSEGLISKLLKGSHFNLEVLHLFKLKLGKDREG